MGEPHRRPDTLRVLGDLMESAEPIAGHGDQVVEYAIPAENYEALVELFGVLSGQELDG